jgi:ABC-type antimicrobial peptide transport system permease subunit
VTVYLVTERTPEIGLRLALGAERMEILRLVLAQGTRISFLGVALGLIGSVFVRPLIASQLFGVGPADLLTLATVSLSLFTTATVATLVAARRATRIDPMTALRYE